jgi:Tfp pilus assembly protein PilE
MSNHHLATIRQKETVVSRVGAVGDQARVSVAAFTLVELMVSTAILAMILVMFASLVAGVQKTWMTHEARTTNTHTGQSVVEIFGRELSPAVVDPRMQFAIFEAKHLESHGHTYSLVTPSPNSPAIFWMAPLGPNGELRMVGYWLVRPHPSSPSNGYRLKRLIASPVVENVDDATLPSRHIYFPRVSTDALNSYDVLGPPKPCDVEWLLENLDTRAMNDDDPNQDDWCITTIAMDNVVAMWIQPLDLSGRPIPWLRESANHPVGSATPPFDQLGYQKSQIIFNSASFFMQNTSADPSATDSFYYKGGTYNPPSSHLRANAVPAAVEVTIVVLDHKEIERITTLNSLVPEQTNVMVAAGSGEKVLDLEASLDAFNTALANGGIKSARRFTTRIEILNGGS